MLFLLTGFGVVMAVVPTASYHFIRNYIPDAPSLGVLFGTAVAFTVLSFLLAISRLVLFLMGETLGDARHQANSNAIINGMAIGGALSAVYFFNLAF
ncbi:hypothetical protein CFBP6625_25400 (plasmid) [Agrobacterium tumefaciens]|nr:hypothetical protein CFBP6625_25400 [Agrobacterium tumefaciens]